jgi:DNA-binding transcriptional ArsR family regulator
VAIFEALAEPNRRVILTMLLERERPVGELVDALDLAQPTVSKHLRSLRNAGLVGVRVDGNRRWYRLEPAPLAELDDWLMPFRRRWADRLDALERHLDNELDPELE